MASSSLLRLLLPLLLATTASSAFSLVPLFPSSSLSSSPASAPAASALAAVRGGGGGTTPLGKQPPPMEGQGGQQQPGKGKGKVVCVTGCNGYVAAELVKQLLERGYHVKGTVRSLRPEKRGRYAFLDALAAAAACPGAGGGTLELVEADLQTPGAFDAAVAGCDAVFHVASPVVYDTPDPQRDLVAPALAGVENVLGAVAKAKAKKSKNGPPPRVVLTSSTGAIYGGPGATPSDAALGLFTEADWNTVATLETLPYYYSKVVAEKRAWALAEAEGLELVVVNPAYVWGPPASPGAGSFNTQRLRAVLAGEQPPWAFPFPVCDTRDIAAVQIAAAETQAATGRYIVSSASSVSPKWIADVVHRRFPGRFPRMGEVDRSIASAPLFDVRRTEALLGRPLTPPEETLVDMVQALLDEDDKEDKKEEKKE